MTPDRKERIAAVLVGFQDGRRILDKELKGTRDANEVLTDLRFTLNDLEKIAEQLP